MRKIKIVIMNGGKYCFRSNMPEILNNNNLSVLGIFRTTLKACNNLKEKLYKNQPTNDSERSYV